MTQWSYGACCRLLKPDGMHAELDALDTNALKYQAAIQQRMQQASLLQQQQQQQQQQPGPATRPDQTSPPGQDSSAVQWTQRPDLSGAHVPTALPGVTMFAVYIPGHRLQAGLFWQFFTCSLPRALSDE